MSFPELAQLQMRAQVDSLVARLKAWAETDSPFLPLQECRALVQRLLDRLGTLQIRLEAPLVVASFGGTGSGKSTLINALVGQECTRSGRERPTTTRPVLIARPGLELEQLGLPLEDFEIVHCDAPLLGDMVMIDAPDPDTTESDTPDSNLSRLRRLLPYCDVLIYTSTQQRYREDRVIEELAGAAVGCRLVFVQTRADIDTDIRDDWRKHLDPNYKVPDLFFVDSLRALNEQQAGIQPSGEFHRLQQLLQTQLTASHRVQIRRGNLVDLLHATLVHCRQLLHPAGEPLQKLDQELTTQSEKLVQVLSERLKDELTDSRQLWERRLLGEVTQQWGMSPFSLLLRLYNGLGGLLASIGLYRARNSAQVALIGLGQAARWFQSWRNESQATQQLESLSLLGPDDPLLRKSRTIVEGYLRDAGLDARLLDLGNTDRLMREATRVEAEFVSDASRQIDGIIKQAAGQQSRWWIRWKYELLLSVLLVYLICWPAYNFFYLHPVRGVPLISSDFYIHGAVFLAIWGTVLIMMFTRRMRRGLNRQIGELARTMAATRLAAGLFPQVRQAMEEIRLQQQQLEGLLQATGNLRQQIAGVPGLGSQLSPRGAGETPFLGVTVPQGGSAQPV